MFGKRQDRSKTGFGVKTGAPFCMERLQCVMTRQPGKEALLREAITG